MPMPYQKAGIGLCILFASCKTIDNSSGTAESTISGTEKYTCALDNYTFEPDANNPTCPNGIRFSTRAIERSAPSLAAALMCYKDSEEFVDEAFTLDGGAGSWSALSQTILPGQEIKFQLLNVSEGALILNGLPLTVPCIPWQAPATEQL